MPSTLHRPPVNRSLQGPLILDSSPGSISLGNILGLRISLDGSWLLIFALISFSLFAGLTSDHPGLPLGSYWGGALVGSLLFFASILLHEISHSLVARSRGMDVHGITLFFFGGVSQLKSEPRRPLDEFLMAIVGPLTSAILGLAFLGIQRVFPVDSLGAGLASWLGWINLALAAFNLLPGFPLDGGRVFRSVAWAVTGNLKKATRIASKAGSVIAFGLIFWGLLQAFIYNQMVQGLWFGFLGWFLLSAAQQSVAQLELRRILGRIRVSEVMRRDAARVSPEENVRRFVEDKLLRTGERCFIVSEPGDTLLGLVTLHELKSIPRNSWSVTTIREVMVPLERLRSTGPDRPLLEALEKMNQSGVHQLPVVEGSVFRGLVTREDVLRRVSVHLELDGETRT
jgi:Zn-dependent protease/CBS domain-containing protein